MSKGPYAKWDHSYLVRIYELRRGGMSEKDIGLYFHANPNRWRLWKQKYPSIQKVLDMAGAKSDPAHPGTRQVERLSDYVYRNLSKELRQVWNEMQVLHRKGKTTPERIEALLDGRGTRFRQWLFFQALSCSNFNTSEACRRVNVPRDTVMSWARADPAFKAVLDSFKEIMKDYAESALFRLISLGDTAATIFVNRTLNADRGYNPKQNIQIDGAVAHIHATTDVDEEDIEKLPLAARRALLTAIRAKRGGKLPPKVVRALPEHEEDAA